MPIFDISEVKETENELVETSAREEAPKDRFFSSMTARVLFFLLLIGDIGWTVWSLTKMSILIPLLVLTIGKSKPINRMTEKSWIGLKRACVCGISLIIALFSPALGIMVACTYFLMYDKSGIQDVVPRSLQDQFQEFIKESK